MTQEQLRQAIESEIAAGRFVEETKGSPRFVYTKYGRKIYYDSESTGIYTSLQTLQDTLAAYQRELDEVSSRVQDTQAQIAKVESLT